jgi:hypothetical protein
MEPLGLHTELGLSDIFGEETMKKLIAGLVVCAALFALGFSSCDGILSSSNEGDGPFSAVANNRGQLKINNISYSLYGNYLVYIDSSGSATNPWSSYTARSSGYIPIDSSAETVSLYSGSQWTGAGYYYVYLVTSSNQILAKSSAPIYFTNGGATINASEQLAFPQIDSNGISNISYSSVPAGSSPWTWDGSRWRSPSIGDNSVTKYRISFTSGSAGAAITAIQSIKISC